jgi:hypothetical protein
MESEMVDLHKTLCTNIATLSNCVHCKRSCLRIEMLELSQFEATFNGLRVKGLITIYVTLHSQIYKQDRLCKL